MKKNVRVFLNHIIESIGLIEEYIRDKEKEEFINSKLLQDAVIPYLEIYRMKILEYKGWKKI
ncbi:MAG: hypothetical protein R6U96_02405 [Promethearchaeia archaeon]